MNPCAVLHRVTILALSLAASPLWPGEAASPTSFELLGSVELPPGTRFEDEPVGGLSGLVWEPSSGHFLALSDDPSERAPARLYELAIDLDDGRLGDGDVSIVRRIRLLDAEGRVFERGALDPEGLALTPAGEVFIGSEGVASSGAPPFIARFGRDGREVERLALDARYLPDGEERRGVRRNLGFESLTVVPDGTLLVSGVENALAQDGAAADVETPSPARLLVRSIGSSTPLREYVYEVGAVAQTPPSDDSFRVNGLVDLAALSGDRFLALEREYVAGMSERVLLYEIDLAGATQVSALESLAGASGIVPVRKRLLLDFAELGVELDNFEAIALGPALADGRRVLVALSDDNFNPAEQRTRLVALALDGREPSIAAIQGAAHRSPLAGRWIAGLSGVVTAVDERARPPAFYLQSERADADPATSEAIRVAVERGSLPGAGSRVLVGGRVEERAANAKQLPVTTLVLSSFETLEASVALPAPVRLGVDRAVPGRIDGDSLAEFRPERDALDFWESLESMRVELPAALVTGPTLSFGEAVWFADDGGAEERSDAGG
ncbi:MAG TPA: esterase-like activity of phytase family protein, partial [Thermoanaerobaculia bacterium]|nr:esterase-like activity of phytase family protein [Thermoanaerobaculia bacterium]